jgi:hypothetical protein
VEQNVTKAENKGFRDDLTCIKLDSYICPNDLGWKLDVGLLVGGCNRRNRKRWEIFGSDEEV